MWRGEAASFSPDSARIAYVPNLKWQESWKRYRGGQLHQSTLSGSAIFNWKKVRAKTPMTATRFGWATPSIFSPTARAGHALCLRHQIQDCEAGSGEQWLRFEVGSMRGRMFLSTNNFGGIYLFDPRTSKSNHVNIQIAADLPATRAALG